MDPIGRIERATAVAAEKIRGVTAGDLSKPTPCTEFDVRQLLNHTIGNLEIARVAADGGKAVFLQGEQFGSDPGAAYEERRAALLETLRGEGVLERTWEMPSGPRPGSMMVGVVFMEHLTHAWDIAKATGQDTSLPSDLVAEATEVVTPLDAMLRRPGICADKVPVPDDASPQEKFIAFMGRRP